MALASRITIVGVFADRTYAQQAVEELKAAGFRDDQIGVAARGEDVAAGVTATGGGHAAEGALTGAAAGAGVGGLWALGIAAGLLPGIGPVIVGGLLASLLASAAGGAAAGGLLGALTGLGIPEEEAQYYEDEFHAGRTVVTVQADGRSDEVVALFRRLAAYDYQSRGGDAGWARPAL